MTAVAYDTHTELVLPEPIGKQLEWLDSDASRKVLRVGRRGAKTRFAFIAALSGHGPGWEQNKPTFPGVLQGGDVVWIAQNYVNLSTVLWREEVIPRMGHLPWVTLNGQSHDVNIPGVGALLLRSGDRAAIDSVRGVGKRLLGVIVDEAAHLDLRGALQDIILPACLDNDAWLVIMSTTNAGSDGGYDDQGAPQIPSYFNLICEEVRAGKRSREWVEFYGTAYDNPVLSKTAIDELVAEYPPGSPKLDQEVYAKLLAAGVGLALPEFAAETHLVSRFAVPKHWQMFGGFDWGYNHPWVFGWYAADEDGNVIKVDTLWGREDLPRTIAEKIRKACPLAVTEGFHTHSGHDIWQKKGQAVGFYGPTIAETLSEFGLTLLMGNNSRVLGLDNMRAYAHVPAPKMDNGKLVAIRPRFRLMDTEGNRRCLAQLQAMQLDPKDLEDALKVDADIAGRGGDDGYDETRMALMSRPVVAERTRSPWDQDNRHPGLTRTGARALNDDSDFALGRDVMEDPDEAHMWRVPVTYKMPV